jgi:hypothetical protein
MAEQNPDPNNPNPQGSGAEGGKLIFGKYKSIEEAEKGYKELERGYHGDAKAFKDLQDTVGTLAEAYGQGGQYRTVTDPNPAADTNANSAVLTELYRNPIGVLQTVKDAAKREVRAELGQEQQLANRNAGIVAEWASRNPDVIQYGDLLSYYVGQTDARLTPDKRLDHAAENVRKRLIEIKQGRGIPNPAPGDFIDAPGGGDHRDGGITPAPDGNQQPDPEANLKTYVASRNKTTAKPLGMKRV